MKATAKPKNGPSAPFSTKSSNPYRLTPPPLVARRLTPQLTDEDRADLAEGVALFNAGKYWESHEAWEKIWKRHAEPWRFFVQGLIQAAAAHHQLRRGIRHGVIKHLRNALLKLDAAPANFAALDLKRFRIYLHALLAAYEAGDTSLPAVTPLRFLRKA